jgi:hypothetical protein
MEIAVLTDLVALYHGHTPNPSGKNTCSTLSPKAPVAPLLPQVQPPRRAPSTCSPRFSLASSIMVPTSEMTVNAVSEITVNAVSTAPYLYRSSIPMDSDASDLVFNHVVRKNLPGLVLSSGKTTRRCSRSEGFRKPSMAGARSTGSASRKESYDTDDSSSL